MNGNKILADTNIFVFMLQGSNIAADFLQGKDVYISIINKIELLAQKTYTKAELAIINNILGLVTIVHTNDSIANYAVSLRKTYNIKLPDALIAATALFHNIALFTADKFFKIEEIPIIEFHS